MLHVLLWIVLITCVPALGTALIVRAKSNDGGYNNNRTVATYVAIGAVVLVALVLGLNCFTKVGAKSVGVEVEFGKTRRTLDSGLSLKKPWTKVTKFDGTIQSLTLKGEPNGDNDDPGIRVLMSDGTSATVEATLQWQIQSSDRAGVRKLYEDYRKPEKIDENFVERLLRAAVYDAMRSYNPSAGIINVDQRQQSPAEIAKVAMSYLQREIQTRGIILRSLTISDIVYPAETKKRFEEMRNAALQRQVADLQAATAKKVAEANTTLSKGAKDSATIQLRCLAITEDALRSGRALPAGWNCYGGVPGAIPIR